MTMPNSFELAGVLNFTDADLLANREGNITKRQLKLLRRKRFGMLIVLVFEFLFAIGLAAFLVVILLMWLNSPFRSLADSVGLLGLLGVTGSLVAIISYMLITQHRKRWLAYGHDLKAGIVNRVTGQLIKTVTKSRYSNWWTIKICGEELPINQKVFSYFEHGRSYHIYFTPDTRIILSVEYAQDAI